MAAVLPMVIFAEAKLIVPAVNVAVFEIFTSLPKVNPAVG